MNLSKFWTSISKSCTFKIFLKFWTSKKKVCSSPVRASIFEATAIRGEYNNNNNNNNAYLPTASVSFSIRNTRTHLHSCAPNIYTLMEIIYNYIQF